MESGPTVAHDVLSLHVDNRARAQLTGYSLWSYTYSHCGELNGQSNCTMYTIMKFLKYLIVVWHAEVLLALLFRYRNYLINVSYGNFTSEKYFTLHLSFFAFQLQTILKMPDKNALKKSIFYVKGKSG